MIIGLLATIVAINVIPAGNKARVEKAKADIATLENALEQYRLDNLTYPSTSDGLQALLSPPPGLAQPERYRQGGYIRSCPKIPGATLSLPGAGPEGRVRRLFAGGRRHDWRRKRQCRYLFERALIGA